MQDRRWRLFPVLMAGCLAAGCGEPSAPDGDGRPNVLLYLSDTVRADGLGRYGNPVVNTPALDALARDATLFENVSAQSSWTRSSVASILTGLQPEVHGVEGRDDRLADGLELLSEVFASHGYATACITANPNIGRFFGFDRGYDHFDELYERKEAGYVRPEELITPSDEVTERAIEWIDAARGPFFLLVLSIDPHAPYAPPGRFDRYGDRSVDLRGVHHDSKALDTAQKERIRSLYLAEISFTDDSFGRLLDHLRGRGLYDETIIAFSSDHGEELWEHGKRGHGKNLFEESLRVPLLLRAEGMPVGLRVRRRVQSVDLFPTLLELAGLPAREGLDGRSLVDAAGLTARTTTASLNLDGHTAKSIVAFPWKLIWEPRRDRWRLYNLELDAGETWDVARRDPERVEELAALLRRELEARAARRARLAAAGPARAPQGELPEHTREALRALGYLEDSGAAEPPASP